MLQDTGEAVSPADCDLAGAALPNGAYLVVARGFWDKIVAPMMMSIMSDHCDLVGCSEDAMTNTSVAFCHRHGDLAWQVSHLLDKGTEHLSVEGQPPVTLRAHFLEACRRSRELGYDAVFDVPAILAQEESGFRFGVPSTVQFTRLLPYARVDGDLAARDLLQAIEAVLTPWGFKRMPEAPYGDKRLVQFVLSSPVHEIAVRVSFEPRAEGTHFHVHHELKNRLVQRFLRTVDNNVDKRFTAQGSLCDEIELPPFIATTDDQEKWFAAIRQDLPALVRRMHSLRGLETLVNKGPRVSPLGGLALSYYSLEAGAAHLILAYLAGSPRLDVMLEEIRTHPVEEARQSAERLLSHLHEHAKPLN